MVVETDSRVCLNQGQCLLFNPLFFVTLVVTFILNFSSEKEVTRSEESG
jgi:hypothetical protein